MNRLLSPAGWCVVLVLVVSCGDDSRMPVDSGLRDTGAADSGRSDSSTMDAGRDASGIDAAGDDGGGMDGGGMDGGGMDGGPMDAALDAALDAGADAAADGGSDSAVGDAMMDAMVDAIVGDGGACTFIERTFLWIDISTTGTRSTVSSRDDGAETVTIPFSFPLLGDTYTTANVSSNGFLQMGLSASATSYTNTRIPFSTEPNRLVSPFWDDLNPGDTGDVYYQVMGTSPNRMLVVTWLGVAFFSGSTEHVTFQAIIHENGGIEFQYQTLGADMRSKGQSATVGIENSPGTAGVQHSFNEPVLRSSLNLTYTCPLPPDRTPPTP